MTGSQLLAGAVYMARRWSLNMVGGPPKATHHITADQLASDGSRLISLDGVSRYLLDVGYEPHVVIDPFTGEMRQLLEASSSGWALEHPEGGPQTNRQGVVNLQVEWFFTPGTLWEGRRYATLTDTPMLGLGAFLVWCDSWGVPRTAPLAPGDRNATRWAQGGHFGHYNAPLNSHVDPIVPIAAILGHTTPPARKDLPMDFTYIALDEDWVFSTGARFHGRLPFGDTLDGLKGGDAVDGQKGHEVLVDLGKRSKEFHVGVKALADMCAFHGLR